MRQKLPFFSKKISPLSKSLTITERAPTIGSKIPEILLIETVAGSELRKVWFETENCRATETDGTSTLSTLVTCIFSDILLPGTSFPVLKGVIEAKRTTANNKLVKLFCFILT